MIVYGDFASQTCSTVMNISIIERSGCESSPIIWTKPNIRGSDACSGNCSQSLEAWWCLMHTKSRLTRTYCPHFLLWCPPQYFPHRWWHSSCSPWRGRPTTSNGLCHNHCEQNISDGRCLQYPNGWNMNRKWCWHWSGFVNNDAVVWHVCWLDCFGWCQHWFPCFFQPSLDHDSLRTCFSVRQPPTMSWSCLWCRMVFPVPSFIIN